MGAAVVIARNMMLALGARQVDTANDYPSAFPLLAKKRYDIVLCDFNLGSGLNGQQLLRDMRHIKRLSYTTLFVVVSAERTKDIVLGTIECEPDGYIAKPFTQGDFKRRIIRLVEQQTAFKAFNEALDQGEHEQALKIGESIMVDKPGYHSLAIRKMAGMLYGLQRYEEAKVLFERALEKHDQTWAKIGRARCIAELGNLPEAIEAFERIVVEQPLAVPAMDSLASCHVREGRKREAQEVLEKSLSHSPMSIDRQRWMGDLSMDIGDLERALKSYKSLLKLADGTLKENVGYHETYLKGIRKAIESEPDAKRRNELIADGRSHLKLAIRKFEDGSNRADSLKLNQDLLRALDKFQQGEAEEAIALVDAAIVRRKALLDEDPERVIDVAETKFYAGDRPGAESMLKKLIEDYPDNKKLHERVQAIIDTPLPYYKRVYITEMNRKGKQQYDKSDFEGALESFRLALKEYAQHPAINLNAAQATLKLIEAGKRSNTALREAKQYLDASVSLEPEHPEFKRKEAFTKYLSKVVKDS
jgi:tetratricopeptide (TPR) repeat protein